MEKLSDLELYQHFVDYVDEVHKDGTCFVNSFDYENFVLKLAIEDSEEGFEAYVTHHGDICFNIDDMEHFFDDFETFKDLFMRHFLEGGKQ